MYIHLYTPLTRPLNTPYTTLNNLLNRYYAVPSRLVCLRALPKTRVSGKIDRKNLPEIPLGNGGKVEKSADPVENWLLALASTVLNVPGMGYVRNTINHIITLYIHPLYTFIAVYAHICTHYTCIYTIYTPLNTSKHR